MPDEHDVAAAYRAPAADTDDVAPRARVGGDAAAFYVVSVPKLTILFIATLGVYGVYWFYRNFSIRKRAFGLDISPVARGIFSLFFAHELFREMDVAAGQRGDRPSFNAKSQATLYVVLGVLAAVLSRLPLNGLLPQIVTLGLGLAAVVPLIAAQKVANYASGDPSGETNAGIDVGSVLACLAGAAFWALILLGLTIEPSPN
jgi:hypothetical protein